MKKIFTLAALAALALNASAANESAQTDPAALGITADGASIAAETVLCQSENVTMKNAYEVVYKTAGLPMGEYKTVIINGEEYNYDGGIQGQTNAPAHTDLSAAAASGSVCKFEVKKDGWLFVLAKLSSNKNYYAYEGTTSLVAYTWSAASQDLADNGLANPLEYTLPATADGYFDATAADASVYSNGAVINWPEVIATKNEKSAIKKNGIGFIALPVYAEAQVYYVYATGSKISTNGFVFVDSDPAGPIPSYSYPALGSGSAAIAGVADAAVAPAKAVKAVKDGQIVVGNYNVLGQQVK